MVMWVNLEFTQYIYRSGENLMTLILFEFVLYMYLFCTFDINIHIILNFIKNETNKTYATIPFPVYIYYLIF